MGPERRHLRCGYDEPGQVFGFSLLGGRGVALDAALLLLFLALAVASARAYWGKDGQGVAANVATFCGAGLLFVVARWWLDEKPVRWILLLAPVAIIAGLIARRAAMPARKPLILSLLVLAFFNWVPFTFLSSVITFLPQTLTETASAQSPDGRLRAVVVRYDNRMDAPYYCVVLRPQRVLVNPTLWPEKTVLATEEGGAVAKIRWKSAHVLAVQMDSGEPAKTIGRYGAPAFRTGQVTSGVRIELLPVR